MGALTGLPQRTPELLAGISALRSSQGGRIVGTEGRSPEAYLPKAAGVTVVRKCTSVYALKAQNIGCDAVGVDGFECGGHPGDDDTPDMILLSRAAGQLEIPFPDSGGMADERSLRDYVADICPTAMSVRGVAARAAGARRILREQLEAALGGN